MLSPLMPPPNDTKPYDMPHRLFFRLPSAATPLCQRHDDSDITRRRRHYVCHTAVFFGAMPAAHERRHIRPLLKT